MRVNAALWIEEDVTSFARGSRQTRDFRLEGAARVEYSSSACICCYLLLRGLAKKGALSLTPRLHPRSLSDGTRTRHRPRTSWRYSFCEADRPRHARIASRIVRGWWGCVWADAETVGSAEAVARTLTQSPRSSSHGISKTM
jgi:hypothetical protein